VWVSDAHIIKPGWHITLKLRVSLMPTSRRKMTVEYPTGTVYVALCCIGITFHNRGHWPALDLEIFNSCIVSGGLLLVLEMEGGHLLEMSVNLYQSIQRRMPRHYSE
jgi:hypothetical protein